ncbi:MAG: (2Fe-2S)-binding protein [Burkholderiaceae bacterium]
MIEAATEIPITLRLNGESISTRVDARLNLVDFVRIHQGLTGTHIGCEHGVCGACTIRVDGQIVRGCLMLAAQVDGCAVDTIEGVDESGEAARLQGAFHRHNALQCGFCTPGMVLTALELLASNPNPSRDEIREHLSGNYCRCTGYQAIVDAVEEVAREQRAGS